MNIRDYVTVNFANMAAIVDAFGGVDIELTAEEVDAVNDNLWALSQEVEQQKETDQANGTYEEQTYAEITSEDYIPDINGEINIAYGEYEDGTYHLNGNQAVAYGRIRYVDSDWGRVERQQTVLIALVSKLTEMGISDYTSLISQLMPYCETSLDLADIVSMTPILFTGFSMDRISVPDPDYETDLFSDYIDNVYHMQYSTEGAGERISAFIYEEDSPYWEIYGDTSQVTSSESSASSANGSSSGSRNKPGQRGGMEWVIETIRTAPATAGETVGKMADVPGGSPCGTTTIMKNRPADGKRGTPFRTFPAIPPRKSAGPTRRLWRISAVLPSVLPAETRGKAAKTARIFTAAAVPSAGKRGV